MIVKTIRDLYEYATKYNLMDKPLSIAYYDDIDGAVCGTSFEDNEDLHVTEEDSFVLVY